MFIDSAHITVRSGNGGNGRASFRREKFVPKGGPDGGDGGRGGDVIIVADSQLATLLDFRYKKEYKAEDGDKGGGSNKTGRDGEDIIVRVPVGTLIRDASSHEVIADMIANEQRFVAAKGGRGGRGNTFFATSTNQAPRTAQNGVPGVEVSINLELKLLADVGLVGFPNAGKSTLISRISAAKPKVADYPFTTLTPNLGIVYVDRGQSFVVADIPGLIEGASQGKGLGHQFLRHVERSGVLCFLLDGLSDDPVHDYQVLLNELGRYNPEMISKRRIVCISKSDALISEMVDEYKNLLIDGQTPMLISAVTGQGIDELVRIMFTQLQLWRQES